MNPLNSGLTDDKKETQLGTEILGIWASILRSFKSGENEGSFKKSANGPC